MPSRETLRSWCDESAPGTRKKRVGGIQCTREQKNEAVIALCTPTGGADAIARDSFLGDTVLATVILDRLLRHSVTVNILGVFLTIKGIGANLAARVLVMLGEDRDYYPSAAALQCEAGTAPVTSRSGKMHRVRSEEPATRPPSDHASFRIPGHKASPVVT